MVNHKKLDDFADYLVYDSVIAAKDLAKSRIAALRNYPAEVGEFSSLSIAVITSIAKSFA